MSGSEISASEALYKRGQKSIVGGNTRNAVYYAPYPKYGHHGDGAYVTDVDGVSRLDCVNCNSASILGYGNKKVLEAVTGQAQRMLSCGMPTEGEIQLAEMIIERLPSAERVRFVNSGTEAVMFCVRAARGYTGRNKIARIEGSYHGSYDPFFVSLYPKPDKWGENDKPASVTSTGGLSQHAVDEVVTLPFNDIDATRKLLIQHAENLACVIVDPMISMMGFLRATDEYLAMLRELTTELGIVLIFDEVVCFRLSYTGAQGAFGVTPDLTALGKMIGGGLPVGAIAGSNEVMSVFDHSKGTPKVDQSGTFSGNPMTMAAGVATLEQMTEEAFAHLETIGNQAREGVDRLIVQRNIPVQVNGAASVMSIKFHDESYSNYRDLFEAGRRAGAADKARKFHQHLLNNGVLCSPAGSFFFSIPMNSEDIDSLLEKIDEGFNAVFESK